MDREIQQRLQWVRLCQETGNAGLVCRRCGISRPTLRKWWKRFQQDGESGLVNRSRRPHHSPNTKVGQQEEQLILNLRKTRNLGARRIPRYSVGAADSFQQLSNVIETDFWNHAGQDTSLGNMQINFDELLR